MKLGDDKELHVIGKGSVVIKLSFEKTRILNEVQYVPHLAHNLLSVGQLLRSGYIVSFEARNCLIKDEKTSIQIAKVMMTKHHMFPLEVDQIRSANLATSSHETSILWYKRYGHLHVQGLQNLYKDDLVKSLPYIVSTNVCEGCIMGK